MQLASPALELGFGADDEEPADDEDSADDEDPDAAADPAPAVAVVADEAPGLLVAPTLGVPAVSSMIEL